MAAIRLSSREKNLALVALGLAIFYIFYQFLLTPKLAEADKLRIQARKLRLDLKVAENKLKILKQVEQRQGAVKAKKKQPLEVEEVALKVLRDLAQTTSRSKLQLLSIKPIITKGNTLKFELLCAGNYQQLYGFLEILHSLDTLVLIDLLTVSSKGGKPPRLDIKISLSAYL